MYGDILFPTDGRPGTEQAMNRAFDLAGRFDATVHALYVLDRELVAEVFQGEQRATLDERLDDLGGSLTLAVENRAADLGIDVVRQIRDGRPYRGILEYADEHGVDLVVMGTRGADRPEMPYLGSTTQRVLARADVPVLTASLDESGGTVSDGDYDRIVIPTDGSDAAERAAGHALALAEQYEADVRAVYVVDTTTYDFEDTPRSVVGLLREGGENALEAIAEKARDRNVQVSATTLRGVPEDEILAYADGVGADLIAMGTRGRSGGGEPLLGSTTARVVRRSTVPVLSAR